MEYNAKYLTKRCNILNSRRGEVKMSKVTLTAPRQLKIEIVKELNEAALYLFEYYVSAITNPVIDLLDDSRVAKTIGWTTRKVQTTRLKLSKSEFLYFHSVASNNVTYNTWVITKDEVKLFKSYNNSLKDIPIKVERVVTHETTVTTVACNHEYEYMSGMYFCRYCGNDK